MQRTLTEEKEIAMEIYGIRKMVVGEWTTTMTKKMTMIEIDLPEGPAVSTEVWPIGGREGVLIED